MAHLIDRDALVAEIKKELQDLIVCKKDAFYSEERVALQTKINMCKEALSFLNTLEVKEVDLNEEAKRKWDSFSLCYDESRGCDVVVWPYWVYKQVCKHFFELGLKAQKGETV